MTLKFAHRKEGDVPRPVALGKVNENFEAIKAEMRRLRTGNVLEIDAGNEKAVRSTKRMVTMAGKDIGAKWKHWSQGAKVYARPVRQRRGPGRPRKVRG